MYQHQKRKLTKAMSIGMLCSGFSAYSAHADSYLQREFSNLPEFNSSTQSGSVSIYGTLDESMNFTKAGSAARTLQMQSGGEFTSQIGVFGREDLGGGLRAEFNIENGFLADTGALQSSSALFNRESWVGLASNDWGKLRLGNQIAAALPLFIDVFGVVSTNSAFAWAGAAVLQTAKGVGYNSDLGAGATTLSTRVADSIFYSSPRIGGFNADMMYAVNSSSSATEKTADQGVVLSYASGPWYLAASYNQVWSSPVVVTSGNTAVDVRNDILGAGGVYDNGNLVLSSSVMEYIPQVASDGIARVYTLGTILPIERHTYRASLVLRDTSGVHSSSGATVSDSAIGLMLGYDYELSKRTGLYARAGLIKNYGASTVILNSAALPLQNDSANPQTGVTSSSIAFGMYHHF